MRYAIYEGDYQFIESKNHNPYIEGEFVLRQVRYIVKPIGEKKWYGILDHGEIIEIQTHDKKRMKVVGALCKFHYKLSQAVYHYLNLRVEEQQLYFKVIEDIMITRKRILWTKEYRMKNF